MKKPIRPQLEYLKSLMSSMPIRIPAVRSDALSLALDAMARTRNCLWHNACDPGMSEPIDTALLLQVAEQTGQAYLCALADVADLYGARSDAAALRVKSAELDALGVPDLSEGWLVIGNCPVVTPEAWPERLAWVRDHLVMLKPPSGNCASPEPVWRLFDEQGGRV